MNKREQDAQQFAEDILNSPWSMQEERRALHQEIVLEELQREHRKTQQRLQWFKGAAAIVMLVNALALWNYLRSDNTSAESAATNTAQQWNSYYYHDPANLQ